MVSSQSPKAPLHLAVADLLEHNRVCPNMSQAPTKRKSKSAKASSRTPLAERSHNYRVTKTHSPARASVRSLAKSASAPPSVNRRRRSGQSVDPLRTPSNVQNSPEKAPSLILSPPTPRIKLCISNERMYSYTMPRQTEETASAEAKNDDVQSGSGANGNTSNTKKRPRIILHVKPRPRIILHVNPPKSS